MTLKNLIPISFILFVILSESDTTLAQCRLDKSQWTLVFNEEFNEQNTEGLLNKNSSDLDPVYSANPVCWENGLKHCPYETICDKTDYTEMYTPLMITMHPNYDPQNQDALGFAEFKSLKDPNWASAPQLPCSGGIPLKASANSWLASRISSLHDDFPMLNTDANTGVPQDYQPGFMYGMFEIRCKFPKTVSSYLSFWLDGVGWPPEIDAFESCRPYNNSPFNTFFSTIHWLDANHAAGNTYQYDALNTFDLYSDFHTWTVVWTPTEVTWFLDGKELKMDNDITNLPSPQFPVSDYNAMQFFRWDRMHMVVEQKVGCPAIGTKTDPLLVDYVKVYRPVGYTPYVNDGSGSPFLNYYNYLLNLYQNTTYKQQYDWVSNVLQTTDFMPVSVVSGLQGLQGGGKFVYKGPFDKLTTTYYGTGPSGPGYFSVALGGGNPTVTGDNIALAEGGYWAYFISGHNLYGNYLNTCYGPIANDVASDVVSNDDHNMVYYINTSGKFTYNFVGANLPYPGINALGSITPNPLNWEDVFYVGVDNNLYRVHTNTYPSPSWQITFTNDVAGSLAILPSIAGDGSFQVFYRSNTGKLRYCYQYDDNHWTTDSDFVAHMWQNTQATPINNVSDNNILVSRDYQHPQIFYVGTDQRPWVVEYENTEWTAAPIDPDLPNVAGDFNLIAYGADPVTSSICYRDYNRLIRTLAYIGCDIINPLGNSNTNPILERVASGYDSTLVGKANNNVYNSYIPNNTNLLLYPNPTTDISYISSPAHDINKVVVSDISGKVVNILTVAINNTNEFKIDLTNHPSGIYIVTIYGNENTNTVKLIKY